MKGKANIGLLILLSLATFVVITAIIPTASALTTDPYTLTPTGLFGKSISVQNGHMAALIYSPNAAVTKTFKYVESFPYPTPHGQVDFYYRNGAGDTWHWWRTDYPALNPTVTQTITSGNKYIQFKITLTPITTNNMKGTYYLR